MGLRFEREAVGIAQASGIKAMRAGYAVNLPDRSAIFLGLDPVLGDVAVGADACLELAAVWARCKALGPMMIDGAAR